ncbi:MAG: glycoside hydrolase family 88 protein [Candidatus Hinthialibacter antarcticus]|nr:glycoside hydrolase family 88 protein [Candidatus Hinthialibacter antarcticus]
MTQDILRRTFIAGAAGLAATWSRAAVSVDENEPYLRIAGLTVFRGDQLNSKSELEVMMGWSVFSTPPAGEGNSAEIQFSTNKPINNASFRITVGVRDRKNKQLELLLAKSKTVIAKFEIRNPALFQPIDAPIADEYLAAVIKEGVVLRQSVGDVPLWFVSDPASEFGRAPAFMPHLFVPLEETDRLEQFLQRMASYESLNEFCWRSGAVMDGLWMLARFSKQKRFQKAINDQLDVYFERLIWPEGKTAPDVPGMENTLTWSTLAHVRPDHRSIDFAIKKWFEKRRPDGVMSDGSNIVTETNYTVAYPLAVIGRQRNDEDLVDEALNQIRYHIRELVHDGSLYLRRKQSGEYYFQNWCRGICWYYIGMVRTLEASGRKSGVDDIIEEIQRCADWIVQYQRDDGLWHTFVHDATTPADTSGTSGIAAAIAAAVRCGWVDDKYLSASRLALQGLKRKLTLDGWLTGVAPGNVGGEALQRNPYRATQQMGMGLMGSLVAELWDERG